MNVRAQRRRRQHARQVRHTRSGAGRACGAAGRRAGERRTRRTGGARSVHAPAAGSTATPAFKGSAARCSASASGARRHPTACGLPGGAGARCRDGTRARGRTRCSAPAVRIRRASARTGEPRGSRCGGSGRALGARSRRIECVVVGARTSDGEHQTTQGRAGGQVISKRSHGLLYLVTERGLRRSKLCCGRPHAGTLSPRASVDLEARRTRDSRGAASFGSSGRRARKALDSRCAADRCRHRYRRSSHRGSAQVGALSGESPLAEEEARLARKTLRVRVRGLFFRTFERGAQVPNLPQKAPFQRSVARRLGYRRFQAVPMLAKRAA